MTYRNQHFHGTFDSIRLDCFTVFWVSGTRLRVFYNRAKASNCAQTLQFAGLVHGTSTVKKRILYDWDATHTPELHSTSIGVLPLDFHQRLNRMSFRFFRGQRLASKCTTLNPRKRPESRQKRLTDLPQKVHAFHFIFHAFSFPLFLPTSSESRFRSFSRINAHYFDGCHSARKNRNDVDAKLLVTYATIGKSQSLRLLARSAKASELTRI